MSHESEEYIPGKEGSRKEEGTSCDHISAAPSSRDICSFHDHYLHLVKHSAHRKSPCVRARTLSVLFYGESVTSRTASIPMHLACFRRRRRSIPSPLLKKQEEVKSSTSLITHVNHSTRDSPNFPFPTPNFRPPSSSLPIKNAFPDAMVIVRVSTFPRTRKKEKPPPEENKTPQESSPMMPALLVPPYAE